MVFLFISFCLRPIVVLLRTASLRLPCSSFRSFSGSPRNSQQPERLVSSHGGRL